MNEAIKAFSPFWEKRELLSSPGEKEGSVSWGIGLHALHDKRELVYFNLLFSCPATGVIRHCFTPGLEPGQAAGVGHTQDAPGDWLLEA